MRFPVNNFSWKNVSQLFGVNKILYEPKFGIPGHNGIDITIPGEKQGYGMPVYATHTGTIEKVVYDVPHRTNGNGLYLLDSNKQFSTVYWHLASFNCNIGQQVNEGDVIGLVGNTGFVSPLPTKDSPYLGTHLHFAILRNDQKGNEYKGFIDPIPFFYKENDKLPMYWPNDLFVGSKGDCVAWLQTCLRLEGFAKDYEPIGYFGIKTLRDVRALQQKYFIEPNFGYFGGRTRNVIKRYSQFY